MHLAYIDPASGSMILQVILGGAAAVAVALKMWWGRVLRFLHIRKPEDDAPAVEQLVEPRAGDRIVDLGCAAGAVTHFL